MQEEERIRALLNKFGMSSPVLGAPLANSTLNGPLTEQNSNGSTTKKNAKRKKGGASGQTRTTVVEALLPRTDRKSRLKDLFQKQFRNNSRRKQTKKNNVDEETDANGQSDLPLCDLQFAPPQQQQRRDDADFEDPEDEDE